VTIITANNDDSARITRRSLHRIRNVRFRQCTSCEDKPCDVAREVQHLNDEVGVTWLFSFLSADRRKSYCLYEAPSEEAIRIAARRANVPADVIVPVGTIPVAEFSAAKYSVLAPTGA